MSIKVSAIRKTFGHFAALEGVSLDFPTGELTALLGPSGCGKTTLLRIIAGLESADSGQVLLDDADASGLHARERRVGFVFQHYALFRHMTVFENIAFGLRVKSRKERLPEHDIRRRVRELLELVQLDWLANRFPAQLSGGQRQRIALARALAVEPQVLLLDEPFGALDAKVRRELRRWLRRLHDEIHVTSIFVTHDQEEALEVADRVVLLNRGRVEQVGTPSEVYDRPATPFVYSFLGAVNHFHGCVDGGTVRVGPHRVGHEQPELRQGAQVLALSRPHELEIVANPYCAVGVAAKIDRVLSFGAMARVELTATGGVGGSTSREFEVELPRARVDRLSLTEGMSVRVVPARMRVFEAAAGEAALDSLKMAG